MTARLDTLVRAGSYAVVPLPLAPPGAPVAKAPAGARSRNGALVPAGAASGDAAASREAFSREARRRSRDEAVLRWKDVDAAGGRDAWVRAQLVAKGLLVTVDPSTLSGKALNDFKEAKRAEGVARRDLARLAWAAYVATHINYLGRGVHWEDGNDPDRFDAADMEERARTLGIPEMKSASDVAAALGVTISQLRWLTFHREVDSGTHYRRWAIPKRNGKSRVITAPKQTMKAAQRWALRNVFEKIPVHGAAHGFLPGRSIVSNAAVHAGADVIVKLDIKDFFPTVGWKRVKGLLRKSGLREGPATLLALLCTEPPREEVEFRGKTMYVASGDRALPQGAPTSPAISNAVCMRMDRRLSGLATKFAFRYTRYADDLAFSWRLPKGAPVAPVAAGLPAVEPPKAPIGALLHGIAKILHDEGFTLHHEKTKVLRRGTSQRVTGLVVNRTAGGTSAPRVPRTTLRALRAAIHNREKGKPGKGESLAQLRGMAAFVQMTDPAKAAGFHAKIDALETADRAAAAIPKP